MLMTQSPHDGELVARALAIISESISLEPDELQDHESWKFLGLGGDLLADATAHDLRTQLFLDISRSDFTKYPTVGAFKEFLQPSAPSSPSAASAALADPWLDLPKPKVPLSIVLQGSPRTASTILYLLPDGSGSGASYAALPRVADHVCLVGLNSPFLRQAEAYDCSIQHVARLWLAEIRRLQPEGRPFHVGGWSAGGYYAFEVAKLLVAAGERVERLVIIDSPCRLDYEALPLDVVSELTRKGMMGSGCSGGADTPPSQRQQQQQQRRTTPEWMVQHFASTVKSVAAYMPTPMAWNDVPAHVDFIWVREGLVSSLEESGLDLDMSTRVTRFLLEPRPVDLTTAGWEKLLPGATYKFEYVTGNHFQITQAKNVESFARALRNILPLE